jgi:NAD(P)-dependent dehydrogenase (short-subunit alcohol dehydrogenase family)
MIRLKTDRNAVVTGATSGIGLATAIELAKQGVAVIGVGRNAERCDAALKRVLETCPGAQIEYLLCDLSSQAQVRKLADEIRNRWGRLDILVNNAGAVSSHFMTSEDGIEIQLAVNHLAPFLLTHELLPLLQLSPQGRVVTVSSGSHYGARLGFNDLQMRRRYGCLGQYKRVKLCNVLFTAELNRRIGAGSNIRAFAADPGLVNTEIGLKGTSGIEKFVWKRRMKGGADPAVPGGAIAWLATEPSLSLKRDIYWYNRTPKRPNSYALREDVAKMLWEASERLCRIEGQGK